MIPTISLTPADKLEWVAARETDTSPDEFLTTLRLRLLSDELRPFNALRIGVTADLDSDGDVEYRFTDLAALHRYYRSVGYPTRSDLTPEMLAGIMVDNAKRAKQERSALREIASILRNSLTPAYSRLQNVPVDIIPVDHVNAWARPMPAGGDAIGLNRHFARSWVWCEWFGWRWLESHGSPWEFLLQPEHSATLPTVSQLSSMHAAQRLASALMGILPDSGRLIDQFAEELQQNGKTSRGGLYAQMLSSIAIAHEFGHIALGHTDWLRGIIEDEVHGKPLRMTTQELRIQQRCNEYAADEFAANALGNLNDAQHATREGRKFKKHVLGWSAVMLFTMFQLATPVTLEDDAHATHPVPLDRVAPLLAIWEITELGAYTPPWWELLLEIPKSAIRELIQLLRGSAASE